MELDDLRRHWRQPEPAAPPVLTTRELDALLRSHTLGPIARMRRNVWVEAIFTGVLFLGVTLSLLWLYDSLARLYFVVMALLGVVSVGVYSRLLRTLRRMDEPTGSVRGHLVTLARGMRQLLRFYYRLTLAAGPLTMASLYGLMLWRMASRGELGHWQKTGVVVVVFLAVGLLTQLFLVRFARWYVQRLYGRHLDHLEGQLRELDEFGP